MTRVHKLVREAAQLLRHAAGIYGREHGGTIRVDHPLCQALGALAEADLETTLETGEVHWPPLFEPHCPVEDAHVVSA